MCHYFLLPEELLSDNGTNFTARVTEELLKKLKVYHLTTTPYRPQTNGMLERFHSVLKRMLGKVRHMSEDWDEYLTYVLLAYRDPTLQPDSARMS